MTKKYHFVYKTINLINKKEYIGDHSTNNLNDKYLGSGVKLNEDLKKYGKNNFKKEIIELFETKQEAFAAQEKYIKKYNTLYPNGYNLSLTGGVPSNEALSEYTKQRISESLKGHKLSEETKKKIKCISKNCSIGA